MNTYSREEKRMQDFGTKIWKKEATINSGTTWEDNIKMDIKEIRCEFIDWIHVSPVWATVTRSCEQGNKTSVPIKWQEGIAIGWLVRSEEGLSSIKSVTLRQAALWIPRSLQSWVQLFGPNFFLVLIVSALASLWHLSHPPELWFLIFALLNTKSMNKSRRMR
jgi:hypothetical protein